MIVTASCIGCKDLTSGLAYREGESWLSADGCNRCQCVAGVSKCSTCSRVDCAHPDVSGCCPKCDGCSYEEKVFADQTVFTSISRPCDRCQCRKGTVTCVTRQCPSLANCREPLTLAGACCAICLSCGSKSNGERWSEDECTSCECMDGNVRCDRIDCGPARCSNPVSVQGVCCPQCNACSFQGLYYNDGQTFSPDGCQSCECSRGNIICVPPQCEPLECDNVYTPSGECCHKCLDGCEYSGRHYDDGAEFTPSYNPCLTCSCNDHKVRCGNSYCPPAAELNCSRPIALPGDCCPSFCPSCVFEGKEYGHGDNWKPASRPCEMCICFNGVVSCRTRRRCDVSCTYGVYEDGECCSPCTDCKLDGEVHLDGSSFARITSGGCAECVCRGGNIQCSVIKESCPLIDCLQPIQIPDTCCPECPQCSNGRSHGDRWRNEADRCEICECRDERVSCYREPCPAVRDDCETLVTETGDCCPVCMDCVSDSNSLVINGTDFVSNTDRCSTCNCLNQEIRCSRVACPPLWCNNSVTPQGECCPICTDCRAENGAIYRSGESFVSDADPCVTCECQEGELDCISTTCAELSCNSPVYMAGQCCPTCGECLTSSGLVYDNGDAFDSSDDKCSECSCIDGAISCSRRKCPAIFCEDPVLLPDKCCPICVTRQCDYQGTKLVDGESVDVGCKVCKCQTGKVICSARVCPAIGCPNPVMGECCPICTDCLYNGEILFSGSSATDLDTCKTCSCTNGTVSCSQLTCPPVDCNFPTIESCCETCTSGCNYEGVVYTQDETFRTVGKPCEECTCVNGSVVCEEETCSLPVDCLETYRSPGECCDVCTSCPVPASTGRRIFTSPFAESTPVASDAIGRRAGDLWMIADGQTFYDHTDCSECTCEEGSLACGPIQDCPIPACTHPRTDACCPSCDACAYANTTLRSGESTISIENPACEDCVCTDGNVQCYSRCQAVLCLGKTKLDDCGCQVCDDQSICKLDGNGTVIYKSGESWTDDSNCACTCERGHVECETCQRNLQCLYREPDPNSCCQERCKGCTVDQMHYVSGATWSQDGCRQTCACHAGIVTCIEKIVKDDFCASLPPLCDDSDRQVVDSCCDVTTPSQCSCSVDNKMLAVGEIFRPNTADVCTVCTCVEEPLTGTSYLECYEPVCPDVSSCPAEDLYFPDAGSCCPICQQQLPYDCTESAEGEVLEPLYSPCEQCLCSGNTWICSQKTCPDIDCPQNEQLIQPGECCPTCAGCYNDAVRQAHGSSWQHETDPCATCRCSYGEIICERTVTCPPLFCTQGRKTFTPVGECCQVCGDPVTGDDCLDSRGRTQAHGSGWPVDDCTQCECLFGQVNCTVEECPQLECKSDETLVIEEGICCPSCVKQPAMCKVYGDPHYRTFDGETLHFQGFCSYEMVKDCDFDTFSIIAVHDDRDTESVSWIKGAIVVAGNLRIRLGQGLWAEVNGVNVTFPFQHSSALVIRLLPTTLVLQSDSLGFKFTWDGAAYGEVEVDSKLKGKLCGLCGNFNDNQKDELTLRDGTVVNSHSRFGDSWKVEGSQCSAVTTDVNPCDVAGYDVKKKAIEQCAILQGEVFAPCHRAVPPDDYVFSCVYDMCACNSTERCLCDVLTAYAGACKNSYVRVQWRTHERCALSCDMKKGLIFDECGPVCPRTCDNFNRPLGELGKECLKPCEPGCQCPAGLVLHNGRCITTDLCP
ncbi:kielin/chordin-like protein [Watersipora subatra]|uniref:kielin/chordin-like protein n=1 Tax=Watersipora subatra TaxID=2589382 RepID=UPI00355C7F6E